MKIQNKKLENLDLEYENLKIENCTLLNTSLKGQTINILGGSINKAKLDFKNINISDVDVKGLQISPKYISETYIEKSRIENLNVNTEESLDNKINISKSLINNLMIKCKEISIENSEVGDCKLDCHINKLEKVIVNSLIYIGGVMKLALTECRIKKMINKERHGLLCKGLINIKNSDIYKSNMDVGDMFLINSKVNFIYSHFDRLKLTNNSKVTELDGEGKDIRCESKSHIGRIKGEIKDVYISSTADNLIIDANIEKLDMAKKHTSTVARTSNATIKHITVSGENKDMSHLKLIKNTEISELDI